MGSSGVVFKKVFRVIGLQVETKNVFFAGIIPHSK